MADLIRDSIRTKKKRFAGPYFQVWLLSKWGHCWRHVISDMFVDIINVFIL